MFCWKEYKEIRSKYFGEDDREANKSYRMYKKAKKKKMNINDLFPVNVTSQVYDLSYTMPCSLGTVEVAPVKKGFSFGMKQEEGNNPMNYATATVQAGTTETQDQRKYLAKRLEEVFYKLEAPLYAQFGLTDDEAPRTAKELAERIKDGKFTIKGLKEKTESDDFDDDEGYHGYWTSLLRWRDPAKKADMDGYSAAMKELSALRQKALDIIKIDEPKAGLDAIKALEAWTPTGAAN